MSTARADAVTALREQALELERLAQTLSRRSKIFERPREAVEEAAAILTDAASELLAPSREKARS